MKYRLLQWLACPACGSSSFSVHTVKSHAVNSFSSHFTAEKWKQIKDDPRWESEITEGHLQCDSCSKVYPIIEGVPRMMVGEDGPDSQHRTTSFNSAAKVWEENFLELSSPLQPNDFLGKLVVDVGCGYGRHTYFAARFGGEVIAIDSSLDAVMSTKKNTENLTHVHVIQADGANLPLRNQVIDRVYCYGVLHHVDNAEKILNSATEVLKPGGSLSLWVYGRRQGLTLAVNNALRGATTNMSHEQLLRVSRSIARSLRLFSHTPYRWFRDIPLIGDVVSRLPVHDHHKWPFEVVVADIYDRLRIPVRRWFTKEELESWYSDHGFANIQVSQRIRNNETFCGLGTLR